VRERERLPPTDAVPAPAGGCRPTTGRLSVRRNSSPWCTVLPDADQSRARKLAAVPYSTDPCYTATLGVEACSVDPAPTTLGCKLRKLRQAAEGRRSEWFVLARGRRGDGWNPGGSAAGLGKCRRQSVFI